MSGHWPEVSLGELISLDKGVSYSGKYLTPDGIPLIGLKSIERGGGFNESNKTYSGPYKPRHVVKPGELVFANTDLTQDGGIIGCPARVPSRSPNQSLITHHLFAVRVAEDAPIRVPYLYHLMRSAGWLGFVKGRASGTTVLGFRREDALDFRLALPPLGVQEKIAAALDAFDALIEINTKRIQILGDIAQAIYREWFVEFRFPGRVDSELVESEIGLIPSDWEVLRLDEAMAFKSGTAIAKRDRGGGHTYVFGANGVIGNTRNSPTAPPCSVLGKIGSCGSLHRAWAPCWVTNNAFAVLPAAIVSSELVWHMLNAIDFTPFIGGSANPYMPLTSFGGHQVRVPSRELQQMFDDLIRPMSALQRVAENHIAALRTTRDFLLPRLVSGEVDVSDLEIDVSGLVA